MKEKIKSLAQKISTLDARSMGLIVIAIVAVSVTYSSAQIIQKNYQLQQEISKLEQENLLQQQINKNQQLQNEFYKTDAYLDIAARRYTNRVSPGEKLYFVPKEVALENVQPLPKLDEPSQQEPRFLQNWREWLDFLAGKPINID